jgi:hypothetical protein
MIDLIIRHFPLNTYALTLVADPDRLLADETIETALRVRGFRLITESDPVSLRHAYSRAQPVNAEQPLIIIVPNDLNSAPYDIWQQAHHVELALHRIFPNLDYPTLKLLSPTHRVRLAAALARIPIRQKLSQRGTFDYLLRHLFLCEVATLYTPSALIIWLTEYHTLQEAMPTALTTYLLQQLTSVAPLARWPLADLLYQREHFYSFVQHAWQAYLAELSGQRDRQAEPQLLSFATDALLQDALPRLVRLGILKPTATVRRLAETPAWATPAIAYDASAAHAVELDEGLQDITERLQANNLRWSDWQAIAWRWAQLTLVYYTGALLPADSPLHTQFHHRQLILNAAFADWLKTAYSHLAGSRLPTPHHLFHVPGYLATLLTPQQRVALLVMDGMSLATWLQIKPVWQARHGAWALTERLLLAQIPSITAVSRQALISGLPPAGFGDTLITNRQEAQQWQTFWMQKELDARRIAYTLLPNRSGQTYPTMIDQRTMRALCLVTSVIDEMVHGATQGLADVHASVAIWLGNQMPDRPGSAWLEGLIDRLLSEQYTVVIASDHGHVNAVGIGVPQEGVTVESRSKRARIYSNPQFASDVQSQYPDTILWHDDGLLPPDRWVLLPKTDGAFALNGQQVVSHGGLTIEEMVTPLVIIQRK